MGKPLREQKVRFGLRIRTRNCFSFSRTGVFWTKFELSLSKTPTKEASPATARQARRTTEKYSLLFSFCARRISFSPDEKSIFLWCPALQVFRQVAGLASF